MRITKDTAILAKQKGFNEQTYSHCWVRTLDGEVIHNSERQSKPEHDRCEVVMMQPTFYELQSWLRAHGVTMWVATGQSYNDEKECMEKHHIIHIHFDWVSNMVCGMGEFSEDEYDEAFETGLQESLKKLKDVE